jgi:hypothetical protein
MRSVRMPINAKDPVERPLLSPMMTGAIKRNKRRMRTVMKMKVAVGMRVEVRYSFFSFFLYSSPFL